MLKVLFIGLVWPEPTSSAAGWRMLHLVKLMQENYEVHFASAAGKSSFSYDLSGLGIKEHNIVLNDSSFDIFISELSPDIVVFDRFMVEEQYGWRVAEYAPKAIRVLDTEDLHFLRLARQESYKKGVAINYYSDTAKREIASILRSDIALIISQFEMNLLIETFKVDVEKLFYLPFQEEKLLQPVKRLNFESRANFVFIGNFIHEPNWRTVEVLKREIWPVIRKKLPQAELHIYGAYASEKVNQLHNPKERFHIKGRAIDARQTIENYRVLLAPIPFGAGAKGKFVDAMFAGTPSVSTSIGAENMLYEGAWGGFVTDDLEMFIDRSVALYTDSKIWYDAQQKGFNVFEETVADNSYSEKWIDCLQSIQIDEFRKRNFIGQILCSQQFQASKYMALWIEQKNK